MALVSGLNSDYAGSMIIAEENPRNWAVNGYDLAEAAADVDGWLASHDLDSRLDRYVFFINFGIIEAAGETEANFKSNYLYIIDALQVKFPNCFIFLTYPSAATGTRGATIKPWIDDVIAARSNIYAGDDEGVWAENGDNYATMYYDNLHYSAAGHAAKVVALRARTLAVLGW